MSMIKRSNHLRKGFPGPPGGHHGQHISTSPQPPWPPHHSNASHSSITQNQAPHILLPHARQVMKHPKVVEKEIHPIIFNLYVCIGVGLSSLLSFPFMQYNKEITNDATVGTTFQFAPLGGVLSSFQRAH